MTAEEFWSELRGVIFFILAFGIPIFAVIGGIALGRWLL